MLMVKSAINIIVISTSVGRYCDQVCLLVGWFVCFLFLGWLVGSLFTLAVIFGKMQVRFSWNLALFCATFYSLR